jgi:hypothetical protein
VCSLNNFQQQTQRKDLSRVFVLSFPRDLMMKVVLVVLALVAIVHCHVFPLGINKHKAKSLKGICTFGFFGFIFLHQC